MTTFGVMCCNCSTKTAVTSDEPPNFCAICGSKEIVLQGEVPVVRDDDELKAREKDWVEADRRNAKKLEPVEEEDPTKTPFRACAAILVGEVSHFDSGDDVSSLERKLQDAKSCTNAQKER